MYLIDTVVISELRKSRPTPAVLRWFEVVDKRPLFLSVITLGEIERGIEKKRLDDPKFSQQLELWLSVLLRVYGGNILPITSTIARRWGVLSAQLNHNGADLLIAATAKEHGLIVATRNTKHFAHTGVDVVDPFIPFSKV